MWPRNCKIICERDSRALGKKRSLRRLCGKQLAHYIPGMDIFCQIQKCSVFDVPQESVKLIQLTASSLSLLQIILVKSLNEVNIEV